MNATRGLAVAVLAIGCGWTSAFGAGSADATSEANANARARWQSERAACTTSKTGDERSTCLKEADAAYAEAGKGKHTDTGHYEANATKRCDALPEAERTDCLARMRGAGTTSGSVAGGGMIRELKTVQPAGSASKP